MRVSESGGLACKDVNKYYINFSVFRTRCSSTEIINYPAVQACSCIAVGGGRWGRGNS